MENKVLKEEKKHLEDTVARLNNAKKDLDKAMSALGKTNIDQLSEMRNNPDTSSADFLMYVQQLHEKNVSFNLKDKIKRVEELDYLIKEPYFARIDLSESPTEVNQFYIGKFGYTEDVPLVTDWRAKVASVYYRYRYPQKNVVYTAPDGEVTRDLDLKRTFEIDNSELLKYYNNDIQLDESEIIADKINERTGGVLEDIVETIQESQLDIIEADPRRICIVQGCVGSGKSTVAIHKLSHIFFNFPEIIQPERAILVAKSGILVSYLATLFPKLGIFDVNYKTLRELVYNLMFREDITLQYNFEDDTNLATFGANEIKILQQDVAAIHDWVVAEVKRILSLDDFASLASYAHDPNISIEENLGDLLEDLNEELQYQKERLKESPGSMKSWIFKENIQNLRKLTVRLRKVKSDVKDKKMTEVLKKQGINLSDNLSYTQVLIYLYVYSELYGFSNSLKYQYCVVDEGQDFSVLEYLVLGSLVLNGRFCVLGDLNQSYVEEGLSNWESIEAVIKDAKNASTFELDTNYRSTKQIIDFANSILSPYTKNYLPKSINRMGRDIQIISTTPQNVLDTLSSNISEDMKHLNKSIGVIVFEDDMLLETQNLLEDIRIKSNLSEDKVIKLEEHTRISYIPKGVYISKFENCKGLEFSKVYILGMNLRSIKDFIQAKKAFVAVTRAMNELTIIES